ncbi:MAG: hypothetical protein R3321_01410 [Nitrososphaeraceae archaeon]|nr:hypothetical protein [Nitrososphaeraceae archaeon]
MEDIKKMTYFDLHGYRKDLIRKGKFDEAELVLQEIFNRVPTKKEEEAARYA